MPLIIVRQDITKMKVDAIVNAANTSLRMGGGVCGAIFMAAGAFELQQACDKLAPVKTGDAVITSGFKLPAKYVIHTAGPVYQDGKSGEDEFLRSCYLSSLELALKYNCISIAFPVISSGIFGYPREKALRVARKAIQMFLEEHDLKVFIVIYDTDAFIGNKKLSGEVEEYIDQHYISISNKSWHPATKDNHPELAETSLLDEEIYFCMKLSDSTLKKQVEPSLDDLVDDLDDTFSTALLRLIDARGINEVDVYKRANLDRKLFSKIRTREDYTPSKRTAIALAIALELSLEETADLLERAGYALTHSKKFDVIIEYFIINGNYDIYEINEVLFNFNQPLLGG